MIMARWIPFCFILFIFLFNNITMMILSNEGVLFKRHIGSARENFFRAKPLSINSDNSFQPPKQTFPSPDVLRARWIELFNEQNKLTQPLTIAG